MLNNGSDFGKGNGTFVGFGDRDADDDDDDDAAADDLFLLLLLLVLLVFFLLLLLLVLLRRCCLVEDEDAPTAAAADFFLPLPSLCKLPILLLPLLFAVRVVGGVVLFFVLFLDRFFCFEVLVLVLVLVPVLVPVANRSRFSSAVNSSTIVVYDVACLGVLRF